MRDAAAFGGKQGLGFVEGAPGEGPHVPESTSNCTSALSPSPVLTAHITGCPMKGCLDPVEDFITDLKATAQANGQWLNRMWPAFYAAAGCGSLRGRPARK